MKKKLLYISTIRYPSQRAYGIQIKEMCKVLAKYFNLTLITCKKNKSKDINIKQKTIFNIYFLKIFPKKLKFIGFYLWQISYYISVFFYLLFNNKKNIIYSREYLICFISAFLNYKTILEMHDLPKTKFGQNIMRYLNTKNIGLIVININIIKEMEKNQIKINHYIVSPSAINKKWLKKIPIQKIIKYKKTLKIDKYKFIASYTGSISKEKGVLTLLKFLDNTNLNIAIIFAGREEDDNLLYKINNEKKAIYLGFRSQKEIKKIHLISDFLLLPNSNLEKTYAISTSPMKLYEYMTSKKPIIASSVKAFNNILIDKKNSIIFKSDSYKSLDKKIKFLIKNKKNRDLISQSAFKDVKYNTWDNRVKKIISYLKKIKYV